MVFFDVFEKKVHLLGFVFLSLVLVCFGHFLALVKAKGPLSGYVLFVRGVFLAKPSCPASLFSTCLAYCISFI